MQSSKQNLIWLDLEMTGLNSNLDRILEIATVITDNQLQIIAEGPVLAIYQAPEILANLDAWNRKHHGNSGLLTRVQASSVNENEAEQATLNFITQYVPHGVSPLCGNTICQDRRFLAHWMPRLEAYCHYRNLDVSTLKILAQRWAPEIVKSYKKNSRHIALEDIYDAIGELRHYRAHFLNLNFP